MSIIVILKKVYSYKKLIGNKAVFKHELENAPWWVCSVFDNVDDITWAWESMYREILDDYVSHCDAKIRKFSLPWINSAIRKAMNKRCKRLRACNGSPLTADTWARYNHPRNEVTNLCIKQKPLIGRKDLLSPKTPSLSGKHRPCKI